MSRGAGEGFVGGAEVDGTGAGESKKDEELLGDGGTAGKAVTDEPGGWDPLPPIGVVLRSG